MALLWPMVAPDGVMSTGARFRFILSSPLSLASLKVGELNVFWSMAKRSSSYTSPPRAKRMREVSAAPLISKYRSRYDEALVANADATDSDATRRRLRRIMVA